MMNKELKISLHLLVIMRECEWQWLTRHLSEIVMSAKKNSYSFFDTLRYDYFFCYRWDLLITLHESTSQNTELSLKLF